ncbi:MAG TPA: prepilin-type N-terminal cleavage/methylation domain-containing protein [Planctomycetota bacterium]|nr:prepilin-type N-terminal cleavage/methylation domain-containing protein [Planctomycetota bacterium]
MPRLSTQRACHQGFTLMELLIVIALIALLATLLLPVLESATAQARRARCLSNEGQVFKAIKIYGVSFDSWYPSPAYADTQPEDTVDDETYYWGAGAAGGREDVGGGFYWYVSHTWRGKIAPYLGARTGDVPAAIKASKVGGYFERKEESAYDIMRCTVVYAPAPYTSYRAQYYGLNGYIAMYTNPQRLRSDAVKKDIAAAHPETMLDTTNTLAIGENWDSHWAIKPREPRLATDFAKVEVDGKEIYAGEVIARHRGVGNWVYYDGHGSSLNMTQIQERNCFLWLPDKEQALP